jgi:hypothetical protein
MSFFQRKPEDPIQAELRRLEREHQFLERQARDLQGPQEEEAEEAPVTPSKPPVRLVFNENAKAEAPAEQPEGRRLGVERKMARNRVILLGIFLFVLLVVALRMLSSL